MKLSLFSLTTYIHNDADLAHPYKIHSATDRYALFKVVKGNRTNSVHIRNSYSILTSVLNNEVNTLHCAVNILYENLDIAY